MLDYNSPLDVDDFYEWFSVQSHVASVAKALVYWFPRSQAMPTPYIAFDHAFWSTFDRTAPACFMQSPRYQAVYNTFSIDIIVRTSTLAFLMLPLSCSLLISAVPALLFAHLY